MALVKKLIVLAVHGDVDEESVQNIMDEKSKRSPPKDHVGPHNPMIGPNLALPDYPKAVCNGVVVAEGTDGDSTRVELYIRDFAHMTGIKQGGTITVTIEAE